MPSPLEEACGRRLQGGGKLLVPFLTAGFPDEERFLVAARSVARSGADLLEVGVPFSDPLADGPTIQRTSQRALEQGATLRGVLDLLQDHGASIGIPIVLMTYLNPVHRFGYETFCKRAGEVGVSGVLVSDLPPDEKTDLGRSLRAHRLDRIVLIAPTTKPERIDRLVAEASGFVYCITRTGVTGSGGDFSGRLAEQVARIRTTSTIPVVAGFGIRATADIDRLKGLVDGVVIGARLLEILETADSNEAMQERIAAFLGPIRKRLGPG